MPVAFGPEKQKQWTAGKTKTLMDENNIKM
jgi:hypothetical protein